MILAGFKVRFTHKNNSFNRENFIKLSYRKEVDTQSTTTCAISILDERGNEYDVIGVAMLHKGDNYCKDEGRKRSLQNAIKKARAGAFGQGAQETFENKGIRAAIWEDYRTSSPTPRWSKKNV